MRNTFLNKVSAERRVLSVINNRLSSDTQLTGLSSAAIRRWQGQMAFDHKSSVVSLLIQLAEKCQSLSDRSNETFSLVEKADSDSIEELTVKLELEFERFITLSRLTKR